MVLVVILILAIGDRSFFPIRHERWKPNNVRGVIRGIVPDPDCSERLARKTQPFRAKEVIDLNQDNGLGREESNNPIYHPLDMPDEIRRVIDLRCDSHPVSICNQCTA